MHEFRITTPESVDRLLDVPHPVNPLGKACQFQEQRELDWARVLKLVDHQQIEFFPEHSSDIRMVEQAEQLVLLIGKVENAEFLLESLIVRQGLGREIEHQCEVTSQVGVQPLMLGYPTGQFRNWLDGRPQARFRSLLGEFGPLAPGSSVTLQIEGKDLAKQREDQAQFDDDKG